MNRNQFFSAVAAASLALIGSSAFAGDEFNPATGFARDLANSHYTRAQVVQQVAAARQDGSLSLNSEVNQFAGTQKASAVTRAAVRSELIVARQNGEQLPNFEVGSAHADWDQPASGLTRAAVRAETLTAIRAERGARRGS